LLKTYLSLFFLLVSFSVEAKEVAKHISWSGNLYKIIKNFDEDYNQFSKTICKPGDENKYKNLLKAYRGQGYYLPKLENDIDRNAIIQNLHHFKKKINHIDTAIKTLKEQSDFPRFSLLFEDVKSTVETLLDFKKAHHQSIRKEKQVEIETKSNVEIQKLKKQFETLMNKIYFLKSYNFPNDFLAQREKYEKYKDDKSRVSQQKANKVFFYRKLVEDGAYDPDHTRPDLYVRSALDTLYFSIMKEKNFLSENVRYDLDWIEKRVANIIERGKDIQLKRLIEWRERTKNSFNFYNELIQTKNKKKSQFLVKKENESSHLLKEFVYSKQAEVYEFWSKKSELHKALFSLETILVHEVGVIDGEFGLERMSVAEVVLNRYYDSFYNQLEKKQEILKYIPKDLKTEDELWLNVLFKTGEFSFTYHYIPSVSQIFCPDMSRRGRGIRKENLKIALKSMKSYNGSFTAFRYFSRISMLGKIDMSTVWTDYVRLPEMVGYESVHQKNLARYYHADKYSYLYSFIDSRKIEYTVVKINETTYSMRWIKGRPVFFDYRNPHLFAYFSKKK